MRIKKISLVVAIMMVLAFIISSIMAFGADSNDAEAYFPLKPGNTWIYQLTLSGSSKTIQQKIKVSDPEDGNPKLIVYDPNANPQIFVYYVENQQGLFKTKEMGPSGILQYKPLWQVLGAKINIGASWSWESEDHKMKETAKVTAAEKVTVPAGAFETILIEYSGISQNNTAYTDKTWYAKGVGYVKDELTMDGKTLTSQLSEYQLAK
ncbi:MAG TPA: hypothetical protein DDW65_00725 [Firmicutes bacterium]|nr:hypothetical protein [Bacillota bacterium]